MDRMLQVPRRRPRPPNWRLPLVGAVFVMFFLALWAAGITEGRSPAPQDDRPAAAQPAP